MKYLNITIRPMTRDDLPSVMEIENLCFKHPWKEKDLIYEMEENPVSNPWVIELEEGNNKAVLGFVDYWNTFDSGTICQIAVHPGIQRRQLGSAMMDEVINDCYAKKVRTLTLEVRVSNAKAIAFYKKHGFKEEVIKKGYYNDGEDALYMIKDVEEEYGGYSSN